ncbi:MAG: YitT family protein [Lachnospiraceae bacterium]|nr:YitT family protein [Lachnospiraceae bacterium]
MRANDTRKPNYRSAWIFPILGLIAAITYALLVFPNSFAPAGVGGISTMLQEVLDFDAGILNLIINLPILIAAWFLVDREFVIKSFLFTASFSAFLMVFRNIDPMILQKYQYHSDNGNSVILAPIAAAVIIGAAYGITLRFHGCTGGTDVLSFIIRRYRPEFNVTWISFVLNAAIAIVSFFVYDFQFEPVICCIIYCFVCSAVGNSVVKGAQSALKFEIVTEEPEKLAADLMQHLKHGVTVISAEGAYTGQKKSLIICIINKHQIADIQRIIQQYPGSFTYITNVSETIGNFRKIK